MLYDPKPLSWGERMELAQSLRKEAAEKIAEAQRIEDGLSADQDAVYAAVEAARARIDAKKVGADDTANSDQCSAPACDECQERGACTAEENGREALERPNVELSGLRGFSRRSARTQG